LNRVSAPHEEPPARTGWICEIQHDGFRIIAEKEEGERVRLITRNRHDFSSRYV
jgi:ATP-dependent DNA ligase